MKALLSLLGIILGVIVVIALGGGLLVLLAYGVGWVLTRFLPFSTFEATLLSLFGVSISGVLAWRFTSSIPAISSSRNGLEAFDEDDWDDDWDDEEWEEEPPEAQEYPGIPRWRQPRKQLDFTNVKPDDRCPCGSGRKYKNCHGFQTKKN